MSKKGQIGTFIDSGNKGQEYYSIENLDIKDMIKIDEEVDKKLTCRICLGHESEVNRFHNFCSCRNSMPTHFKCLQLWLENKITVNE